MEPKERGKVMSNIFEGLGSDGIQKQDDRLGGFQIFPTDIYEGEIKAFYSMTSDGGAKGVTLVLALNGKDEFTSQVWVTSKDGKNYYEKDGVKSFLPGWNHADNIALVATGNKGLGELKVEEKVVQAWDNDAKKQMPKTVPMFTEVLGKKIWVAIEAQVVDQTAKNERTGKYEPTGKTREQNDIVKVFDYETKKTVPEALEGKEAEFFDAWLAKYKGKVSNRAKGGNSSGTTGKPGGAPPQQGQSERPSLFGGKK